MDESMRMSAALEIFTAHLAMVKSKTTAYEYTSDVRRLIKTMGDLPLDAVRRVDLLIQQSRLHGLAAATHQRVVVSWRQFFRFCHLHLDLPTNPADGLVVPRRKLKMPVYLDEHDLRHLLAQPDTSTVMGLRDHALLVLLAHTGLRRLEASELLIANVDLRRGIFLTIRKGGNEQLLPMNDTVIRALSRWMAVRPARHGVHNPHVFCNFCDGGRLGPRSISRIVGEYARAAGLSQKITPHKLRHTFATLLVRKRDEQGNRAVSDRELQELMGHKEPKSTMVYTHLIVDDLRHAVNQMPATDHVQLEMVVGLDEKK